MNRLKSLRLGHGLTQEGLAHKAGLSFTTINKLENGHHQGTETTLRKLAKVLGLPQRAWKRLVEPV